MFPLELGSLLATPSDWECLRSNTGKGKPRGVVRSVKALCSVLCLPRLPSSGVTDVFLFSYPFSSLDDSELERRWEGITREHEAASAVSSVREKEREGERGQVGRSVGERGSTSDTAPEAAVPQNASALSPSSSPPSPTRLCGAAAFGQGSDPRFKATSGCLSSEGVG